MEAGKDTYQDECPADCGFTAAQCRHCWCACSSSANPKLGTADEWLEDIVNVTKTDAFCANQTAPLTTQLCSNDEHCHCMYTVQPFPQCHGCGFSMQERDVELVDEVGFAATKCSLRANSLAAASSAGLDWEMIMQIGDDDMLKYDSPYWENKILLNALDADANNRKLPARASPGLRPQPRAPPSDRRRVAVGRWPRVPSRPKPRARRRPPAPHAPAPHARAPHAPPRSSTRPSW